MGSIGINYFATKTKMIPNEYADKFKTQEGRKSLINEFGNEIGAYTGKNEDGEECLVLISRNGMQITTFQNNGWTRKDTYDIDGYKTEEEFTGKWR